MLRMADMSWRLLWFFIIACAVSYTVFLVAGSTIKARALDESRTVLARDSLEPGVHYLSGIVTVRSTCAHLSVSSEKVSETSYHLRFSTWEEPSVPCVREDVPRSFRTVVFAPAAGITFLASLDDEPLQLIVIQALAKSDIL